MSKMLYNKIKRVADILISLFLLVITFPILLLVSILIYITDRGEIFVKEPKRIGQDHIQFRMYKFRTMIPNAHEEILQNPKYRRLREKWEKNDNKLKIDEDIRITPIGRILRKTDIDELPQLFNILKGEMSLVGPRPMYTDEIERHLKKHPQDSKYIKQISKIKPGLTGIWQVSGRNQIPFSERLQMDTKYTQEQNIVQDIKILLKTPYTVLTRKGAYE